jgi:hypothetical protein
MQKVWRILAICLTAACAPQEVCAQGWFDAETLFWSRTNDSSTQFLSGASALDSGDLDLGWSNGYRLTLGTGLGDYEIEAQYSRIDDWSDSASRLLARPLAFDNNSGNAIVFPVGADTLGFTNGLFNAATNATGAVLTDETTESEHLLAGAAAAGTYNGELQDFQLNLGTNRELAWYRFGIGYRNLRINEGSGFLVSGTFDARDNDDGAGPGGIVPPVNGPNDQLSHASLIAAGFTNIGGLGDGYDAVNPALGTSDRVAALFAGSTDNSLNGVQLTGAVRAAPNDIFEVEAFSKVGLFYNRATGGYSELVGGSGSDNSIYLRQFTGDRTRGSFGLNLGVRGLLNLTDYISLTAGYELLLLTNIALAPDQYARVNNNVLGTGVYSFDASGLFVGHGGNIGLEIRW